MLNSAFYHEFILKFLVSILLVLNFGSCTKKNEDALLNFDFSTINIPINEGQLNSYQVLSPFRSNNENFLIAYNEKLHSFDYFNLDQEKVLKSVKIQKEGPNGFGRLESIFAVSRDSIFLYELGKVHLIDENLIKKKTWDLFKLYGDKGYGVPQCNYYFKLFYDSNNANLYFYMNPIGKKKSEIFDFPLVTSLNLLTNEIVQLPIFHSDYFKRVNGELGYITALGFGGILKNKFIFNFQYESPIYSYNLGTKEFADPTDIELEFIPHLIPSTDENSFDKHAISNKHFLSPVLDPKREFVYSVSWGVPTGGFLKHSFLYKTQSLRVFDSNLDLLKTIYLPDTTYQINNWFINDKGLYLNRDHPGSNETDEDFLIFDILSIK